MNKSVVWFHEVDKNDIALVGGKGANLGEMTKAGFPIPYGFIVTSRAYFDFLKKAGLKQKISDYLRKLNHKDPKSLRNTSTYIQRLILDAQVPDNLAHIIAHYYEALYEQEKRKVSGIQRIKARVRSALEPPLVAVRSSATAEDLPGASFAGQQDTFLNIQGEADLIEYVKACWASLFTERAIFYRSEQGFDHFKVGLAAVVQRMVQSEESGIMFTVDPVTNDKKTIAIEAIFGLGEYIVQGKVTPDQYYVDKASLEIKSKKRGVQDVMFVKRGKQNIEKKLSAHQARMQKIDNKTIIAIAKLGKEIERHYYFPQDIEWAIEKDKVFIVQSRPITTLEDGELKKSRQKVIIHNRVFMTGDSASPGLASGKAVILSSPHEINKIKKGDVLVASQTNPDYVPAMKRAAAIITEHGGRTSHAAIVSRELGIPCVVGVVGACSHIKEGTVVTVNGMTGEIYKGEVEVKQEKKHYKKYKTKTKIYLNIGEPDRVDELSKLPADGIGLLRAEFMIANIGEHPKSLLKKGKGSVFINRLSSDLIKVCRAFNPRPIVYRTTDFKTNEYRHLKGGAYFEPNEENPMLGYRGTYRYITDPEVFSLEIEALKRVRSKGYKNIHIMFPFVRSPEHIIRAKQLVEENGLKFGHDFKLWMMVELPVNIIMLEKFLEAGVDGVSIGSNDLTMLTLGIDRDNEALSELYNERNPAVLWAVKHTISVCNKHGVTSSICGQSVSDYPEMLSLVVGSGITSVSISPDAFWRVNEEVYNLEHGVKS